MPLPVGTWTINADGSPGSLAVGGLTPDGSGNSFFTGTTTFGSNPADNITGFWDETGQEIAFLRLVNPSYPIFQVYAGKLFSFKKLDPRDTVTTFTLAGDVRDYSLTNTSPPIIPAPGLWCAQIVVTVNKAGKDGKDKEGKDGKDGKEAGKDKEGHVDKIPIKDKDAPLEQAPLNPRGSISLADQLALRVSALEQQIAIGRSFIAPDERPAVGAGLSSDRA